jgi:deazaflavin-dependent oxidoreductase (nitroreductase family)
MGVALVETTVPGRHSCFVVGSGRRFAPERGLGLRRVELSPMSGRRFQPTTGDELAGHEMPGPAGKTFTGERSLATAAATPVPETVAMWGHARVCREGGKSMAAQDLTGHRRQRQLSNLPPLLNDRRAWLPRLVFRSPILLYRVGLGGLLGHQFLLLTHAGRRTGRVHETVLKVLHYDPATCESIVASAWGSQSDWYRNLQARPALTVQTGGAWYVPHARAVPRMRRSPSSRTGRGASIGSRH